jgi:3-ketoacyl-CoA synthase
MVKAWGPAARGGLDPDNSSLDFDYQRQNQLMKGETLSLHEISCKQVPDFLQSVNLQYVKLGYYHILSITYLVPLLLIPSLLLGIFILQLQLGGLAAVSSDHNSIWQLWEKILQFNLLSVIACLVVLVCAATVYFMSRSRPIYLVDFACFVAKDDSEALKVPFNIFIQRSRNSGYFNAQSIEFQQKIMQRSGLSESTYLPPALAALPPCPSMKAARVEAETVVYACLDELFEKTKVKPKEIGVLIVNCSLFSPTPSLSAMIVNKYKMRGDIRSYNLGGMGCSASLISVDLARDILQLHGYTYAIVVSTENITQNWYFGNVKSMLIPNCLFRVGGTALLLSNKSNDKRRSKYKLKHLVRTHRAADDKSYRCVYQDQDSEGKMGVSLSKDILTIAAESVKTNITTLGPLVLPFSEQIIFFANLVAIKLFNMKQLKAYIPDFRLAFDHFCIHAGGRAVIDELEKHLLLTPQHCEASRMTLHRFGNTSSSTIWYELAYIEAKGRVKKGQRVWQLAFGGGFKCNSAVWQSLHTIQPSLKHSPWAHCIDNYPVKVPDTFQFDD